MAPNDTEPGTASAGAGPAEACGGWGKHGAVARQVLTASVAWAGVVAVMLAWTWGAWPNPIVDFGREVYVPWRLCLGDCLYRDLAYFNGPLSPYFNCLVFWLSGPSVAILFVVNFVIHVLIAILICAIIGSIASWQCGALCVVIFELLFAFGQYASMGNYTYVAPYSHEMTHGIFLSLLCLLSLRFWLTTGRLRWPAGAGLALGLILLSKPEPFLASAAACVAAFLLVALRQQARVDQIVKALLGLFITAALVFAIAVSLLATYLPWRQALYHALGSWAHMGSSSVTGLWFYRVCMGLDEPLRRTATLVFWLCVQVLLSRLALRKAFRRRLHQKRLIDLLLVLLAVAIAGFLPGVGTGAAAFSPLPVWLAAAILVGLYVLRRPDYQHCRDRIEMALVFGVFAIAMLAKMPLHARVYHYGFVLAMPGVLAMAAACWWVKNEVQRRGGSGARFAAVPGVFLAVVTALHLVLMAEVVSAKDALIQAGTIPRLRATSEQAEAINTMLTEIEARTDATSTLAVWPEGALVNFLTRRRNTTPYTVLIPPEIAMFGEETILASYRKSPPDLILFVNRDISEYGVGSFQEGYARQLWQWLRRDYRVVCSAGADPSQSDAFGMALMERCGEP